MRAITESADQADLADALGVDLDPELLRRALTHRSYAYEHGGLPHNERLEFLGDAVLGVIVTEILFRDHPDLPEGRLAKLRASIVNMGALAEVARAVGADGLGTFIRLGHGEQATGGRDKSSILADTVEALLGAIFLQHGLVGAQRVVHALFDELIGAVVNGETGLDWKTSLQEYAAETGLGVPEYLMSSDGPDHEKVFTARAQVDGRIFGACAGRSKKQAEQGAAEAAWRALTAVPATPQAARDAIVPDDARVPDEAAAPRSTS